MRSLFEFCLERAELGERRIRISLLLLSGRRPFALPRIGGPSLSLPLIAISLITAPVVAAVALIPIASAPAMCRLAVMRFALSMTRPRALLRSAALAISLPSATVTTVAVSIAPRLTLFQIGPDAFRSDAFCPGGTCSERWIHCAWRPIRFTILALPVTTGTRAVLAASVRASPVMSATVRRTWTLIARSTLRRPRFALPLVAAARLVAPAATALILPIARRLTVPLLAAVPSRTPHIFHFDRHGFCSCRRSRRFVATSHDVGLGCNGFSGTCFLGSDFSGRARHLWHLGNDTRSRSF